MNISAKEVNTTGKGVHLILDGCTFHPHLNTIYTFRRVRRLSSPAPRAIIYQLASLFQSNVLKLCSSFGQLRHEFLSQEITVESPISLRIWRIDDNYR